MNNYTQSPEIRTFLQTSDEDLVDELIQLVQKGAGSQSYYVRQIRLEMLDRMKGRE